MTTARQARRVGLVMAGTMVVWLMVQDLGRQYGWDPRYAFLADFAALAAYVWALVATYRIWRARRESRG